MPYNTEEIRHPYKSKHTLKRNNQVILLMTADGKKWALCSCMKMICIA